MAEPTVADLMADIVATIKANSDVDLGNRVVYPPTDAPPQALVVLLDYGPVTADAGQFETQSHTVVANVMAPLKGGGYPWAYGVVTEAAQAVRWGLRRRAAPNTFADEAIVIGIVQDRARAGTYAQTEVVAATVTWTLETKSDLYEELEAI